MNATLKYLPLGSVSPKGFIKEQLIRSKHGMGGNLAKIEPAMIAYPYIKKTRVDDPSWGDGDQSGWGAEISGNYYSGLCMLAYTLKDPELIAEFEEWVNAVLKTQREDGYLGTYTSPTCDPYEDFNAWGTTQGMKALLYYYEATGREDVLTAVCRCMKWFCRNWAGDKKTSYAGVFITEPMMWCYRLTGDREYLDFCIDYQKYMSEHDLALNSYKSMLDDELVYNSQHTVAYCCQMHLPALVYEGCGNETFLKSSVNGIDKLNRKSLHVTGSPVSVNEYLGPVSSVNESEYCNFRYYNNACSHMSRITGESKYADMIEICTYNGIQGARKKDERAIAYFSAPNQIYATKESSTTFGDYQVYSPCYPVSCCPVNSVLVMPEFLRSSVLADDENGIHIFSYVQSRVEYNGWDIDVDTNYPFDDTVNIKANGNGKLYLRYPSFASSMDITVNGKAYYYQKNEKGFVAVPVEGGAEINITFGFDIKVVTVDDSDAANKKPLAIRRGPLVFSLPIKEKWTEYIPNPDKPLAKEWPWFNVTPVWTDADVRDHHEMVLLRKYHTTWNVCLDENLDPADITVNKPGVNGYAWENAPITLTVPAYRAPFMCAPYPGKTFDPFGKKQKAGEEMTLTLVPYGCTNLRITYFPRAKLDK